MPEYFENFTLPEKRITEYFGRLKAVYAEMDKKYKEAADYYGFNCTGCEQNCCMTHFHHHTHIEYFYILEGLKTLSCGHQVEVKEKAAIVKKKTHEALLHEKPLKHMCALNADGLCALYDYRPMICRLHGIPSELNREGQNPAYSPGCEAFTLFCGGKKYYRFDRTPLYNNMARIESELKAEMGTTQKFKKTIAEMLVE